MFSLRRLQSVVLGYEQDPDIIRDQLQAASVPVTAADCRTCSNPCEEGQTFLENDHLVAYLITHQ